MVNYDSWSLYSKHLSTRRLAHYLFECTGNIHRARKLYDWNVEISAAFWETLAYFEVAFRNALDTRLQIIHEAKGRNGHWIFDDAFELGRDPSPERRHGHPFREIAAAQRHVIGNRMEMTPDQILSELPFGFWHQMVSKRQMFLWPDLTHAFPWAEDRSQDSASAPVGRLRAFRNRIGHHHRIWSADIEARYRDVQTVSTYIDPQLSEWIDSRSRVLELLSARP